MDEIINNTQVEILSLLARFKFLVVSQMQPILKKSVGYIREQLASLTHKGYIKAFRFDRPGKAPNMYHLTEAGKELIMQFSKVFDTDIKLPIGVPVLVKDFEHRKKTVDIAISLFFHLQAKEIVIREYHYYFDKQGDNRRSGNLEAKTKIPIRDGFFIPDSIMLSQSSDKTSLFLVEMYCDSSSTRVLEQLQKHILALAEGTASVKWGLRSNAIVLSCFYSPTIKAKTIEKLKTRPSFKAFEHLFFFASLDDVVTDCGNAWHTVNGDVLKFL